MHDVKWVLLIATVAVAALFLVTLFSSISLRERAPGTIRRSLFTGAWITLGLIAVLGVVGFFGWEWPTKYRKLKAERRRQERQELRVKLASARVGDN